MAKVHSIGRWRWFVRTDDEFYRGFAIHFHRDGSFYLRVAWLAVRRYPRGDDRD